MSAVDLVARGQAAHSLANPAFLKGAALADRIRIVAGIDSLTEGGGSPSSTWRSTFAPYAKSVLGDGGPGIVTCSIFGNSDYAGYYAAGGVLSVAALAWNHALRQKSFFGNGLYTAGTTAAYWGCAAADETNLIGVRLICELRSDDASFRWKQNSGEANGTANTVSVAGGYAKNALIDLFRRATPGASGAKGIAIDQVVGDVSFHAMEFVHSTPGVTLTNLGLGGAKASDWAQLDDARMREFIRLINADVMLLNAGVNDKTDTSFNLGKNLTTIVDRFKTVPTTNLIVIRPNDTADVGTTNLQYFTEVIRGIANSRGCGFMDVRDTLGTYAAANAAGYMAVDGVHPSPAGNALIDRAIRRRLSI